MQFISKIQEKYKTHINMDTLKPYKAKQFTIDFTHRGKTYYASLTQPSGCDKPECMIFEYENYAKGTIDFSEVFCYNPMRITRNALLACVSMFIYREFEYEYDNE